MNSLHHRGDGNRLTEDASYTYQYDAEGNRTRRTKKADGSYEASVWDHRNRLVRVEFRTAANVLTQQVAYDYDALDNLIRRRADTNGDGSFDETQSFVLDLGGKGGLDDVVLAFDGAGTVEHRYLHGAAVDELFADESAADGLLWALADRQGTVKDWVQRDAGSGTTSVFNHVEFDGYGKITSQTNTGHTITAGGYTGRFHDPLTGLRYHRARWADPNTGWISEDPIGFGGGDVNLYRVVGNGPGNANDPSGLQAGHMGGYIWPDGSVRVMPYPGEWPGGVDPNGLDPQNPPPELVPFTSPEDPKPTIDYPSLQGDICIGVELDAVQVIGIEAGAGGVLDLNSPLDSGGFFTRGLALGYNVGLGVGGSYTPGDIEGGATNVDVNLGIPISVQGGRADSGEPSGGVSYGPGGGASVSYTVTSTFSIRDLTRCFERSSKKPSIPPYTSYPPGWSPSGGYDGGFPEY